MICCNELQLASNVFFNIMSGDVVDRGQEAIAPYSISPMSSRGGVDGLMASTVPKSDSSMGDDIYSVLPRLLLLSPIFLDDGLVVEILTPVRSRLWEIVCLRAGWN